MCCLRTRPEYYVMRNGGIWVVTINGSIGLLPPGAQEFEQKYSARQYWSWRMSNEHTASEVNELRSADRLRKQDHNNSMIFPYFRDIIGFQTDIDECVVFNEDGTLLYEGKYDGRRFPSHFNGHDNDIHTFDEYGYRTGALRLPVINETNDERFGPAGKIRFTVPAKSELDNDDGEPVSPELQLRRTAYAAAGYWFGRDYTPCDTQRKYCGYTPYAKQYLASTYHVFGCEKTKDDDGHLYEGSEEVYNPINGDTTPIMPRDLLPKRVCPPADGDMSGPFTPTCQEKIVKRYHACGTRIDPDIPLEQQIQGFEIEMCGNFLRIVTHNQEVQQNKWHRVIGRCEDKSQLPQYLPRKFRLKDILPNDCKDVLGEVAYQTIAQDEYGCPLWWKNYLASFYIYGVKGAKHQFMRFPDQEERIWKDYPPMPEDPEAAAKWNPPCPLVSDDEEAEKVMSRSESGIIPPNFRSIGGGYYTADWDADTYLGYGVKRFDVMLVGTQEDDLLKQWYYFNGTDWIQGGGNYGDLVRSHTEDHCVVFHKETKSLNTCSDELLPIYANAGRLVCCGDWMIVGIGTDYTTRYVFYKSAILYEFPLGSAPDYTKTQYESYACCHHFFGFSVLSGGGGVESKVIDIELDEDGRTIANREIWSGSFDFDNVPLFTDGCSADCRYYFAPIIGSDGKRGYYFYRDGSPEKGYGRWRMIKELNILNDSRVLDSGCVSEYDVCYIPCEGIDDCGLMKYENGVWVDGTCLCCDDANPCPDGMRCDGGECKSDDRQCTCDEPEDAQCTEYEKILTGKNIKPYTGAALAKYRKCYRYGGGDQPSTIYYTESICCHTHLPPETWTQYTVICWRTASAGGVLSKDGKNYLVQCGINEREETNNLDLRFSECNNRIGSHNVRVNEHKLLERKINVPVTTYKDPENPLFGITAFTLQINSADKGLTYWVDLFRTVRTLVDDEESENGRREEFSEELIDSMDIPVTWEQWHREVQLGHVVSDGGSGWTEDFAVLIDELECDHWDWYKCNIPVNATNDESHHGHIDCNSAGLDNSMGFIVKYTIHNQGCNATFNGEIVHDVMYRIDPFAQKIVSAPLGFAGQTYTQYNDGARTHYGVIDFARTCQDSSFWIIGNMDTSAPAKLVSEQIDWDNQKYTFEVGEYNGKFYGGNCFSGNDCSKILDTTAFFWETSGSAIIDPGAICPRRYDEIRHYNRIIKDMICLEAEPLCRPPAICANGIAAPTIYEDTGLSAPPGTAIEQLVKHVTVLFKHNGSTYIIVRDYTCDLELGLECCSGYFLLRIGDAKYFYYTDQEIGTFTLDWEFSTDCCGEASIIWNKHTHFQRVFIEGQEINTADIFKNKVNEQNKLSIKCAGDYYLFYRHEENETQWAYDIPGETIWDDCQEDPSEERETLEEAKEKYRVQCSMTLMDGTECECIEVGTLDYKVCWSGAKYEKCSILILVPTKWRTIGVARPASGKYPAVDEYTFDDPFYPYCNMKSCQGTGSAMADVFLGNFDKIMLIKVTEVLGDNIGAAYYKTSFLYNDSRLFDVKSYCDDAYGVYVFQEEDESGNANYIKLKRDIENEYECTMPNGKIAIGSRKYHFRLMRDVPNPQKYKGLEHEQPGDTQDMVQWSDWYRQYPLYGAYVFNRAVRVSDNPDKETKDDKTERKFHNEHPEYPYGDYIYFNDRNAPVRFDRALSWEKPFETNCGSETEPNLADSLDYLRSPFTENGGRLVTGGNGMLFVFDSQLGRMDFNAATFENLTLED